MLRTQCTLRIVFVTACCLSAGILLSCRQQNQQPTPGTLTVQDDANKKKALAVMYQGTAAVEAAKKIKEKIGAPVMVLDVSIAPGYLSVDAQDPKDPKKLSHYEYRNGTVSGPTPVRLSDETQLESQLFSLDEVNLAAVANVAQAANERLKIDGGEVQGMDIRRNLPVSKEIRWHVGVTGPQKGGFVDADEKGNIKDSRIY
jgi:hypothetical protein